MFSMFSGILRELMYVWFWLNPRIPRMYEYIDPHITCSPTLVQRSQLFSEYKPMCGFAFRLNFWELRNFLNCREDFEESLVILGKHSEDFFFLKTLEFSGKSYKDF